MKIGFIGLGAMGRGMAANLQKAGHDLVVNDMRPEAAAEYLDNGATWASAPGALAAQVQLVEIRPDGRLVGRLGQPQLDEHAAQEIDAVVQAGIEEQNDRCDAQNRGHDQSREAASHEFDVGVVGDETKRAHQSPPG